MGIVRLNKFEDGIETEAARIRSLEFWKRVVQLLVLIV